MPLILNRSSIITSTLKSRSNEYKQVLIENFKMKIMPSFGKKLKPIIDSVFDVEWDNP